MKSLGNLCLDFVAEQAHKYSITDFESLPVPVLKELTSHLSAYQLNRLNHIFDRTGISTHAVWSAHLTHRWTKSYQKAATLFRDELVNQRSPDPRQVYLERLLGHMATDSPKDLMRDIHVSLPMMRCQGPYVTMKCQESADIYDDLHLYAPFVQVLSVMATTPTMVNLLLNDAPLLSVLQDKVCRLDLYFVNERNFERSKELLVALVQHGTLREFALFSAQLPLQQLSELLGIAAEQSVSTHHIAADDSLDESVNYQSQSLSTAGQLDCPSYNTSATVLDNVTAASISNTSTGSCSKDICNCSPKTKLNCLCADELIPINQAATLLSNAVEWIAVDDRQDATSLLITDECEEISLRESESTQCLSNQRLLNREEEDSVGNDLTMEPNSELLNADDIAHTVGSQSHESDDLYDLALLSQNPNKLQSSMTGYKVSPSDVSQCHGCVSLTMAYLKADYVVQEALNHVLPLWSSLRKLALLEVSMTDSEVFQQFLTERIQYCHLSHLILYDSDLCQNILDVVVESLLNKHSDTPMQEISLTFFDSQVQKISEDLTLELQQRHFYGTVHLDLSYTFLSTDKVAFIPLWISHDLALRHLYLINFQNATVLPDILSAVLESERLQTLCLEGILFSTEMETRLLEVLQRLKSLQCLNLNHCGLSAEFVSSSEFTKGVTQHRNLSELHLSDNRLEEAGCGILKCICMNRNDHGKFHYLDLSYNRMDGNQLLLDADDIYQDFQLHRCREFLIFKLGLGGNLFGNHHARIVERFLKFVDIVCHSPRSNLF